MKGVNVLDNVIKPTKKELAMWDRILNMKAVAYMLELSKVDGDLGEDSESIMRFFIYLKEHISYPTFFATIIQWSTLNVREQTETAINMVGEYHASRFFMLMDYLSYQYKKGRL